MNVPDVTNIPCLELPGFAAAQHTGLVSHTTSTALPKTRVGHAAQRPGTTCLCLPAHRDLMGMFGQGL